MAAKRMLKWFLSLLLIAMMYVYAMFQGGFVSWFLFYSVTPLIVYALFIGLFPLRSLKVQRILSAQSKQAGQSLQVTLAIEKPIFPLFYLVVEDVTSRKLARQFLSPTKTKHIFFPLFKRNLTYTYTIENLPRGEHTFERVVLKTGDLFGFIQKRSELLLEETVLVYPRIEQVEWRESPQRSLREAPFHTGCEQDVSSVVGIREYIPGDRLTWIDWKATAKRNKLVTKQFEQRVNERIVLFLDNGRHVRRERFEKAVVVTASLIAYFERKGEAYVFQKGSVTRDPTGHRSNYTKLATIEADREEPFAKFVRREMSRFQLGKAQVVLIVTEVTDELVSLIGFLTKQRLPVVVYVITERAEGNGFRSEPLQRLGVMFHVVNG